MQASDVHDRSLRRASPGSARRCLAALAALVCAAVAPVAHAAPRGHAQTDRQDAFVIGSSSVGQSLGRIIERELEERGYDVRRKGVSSAGLSRPDHRDMQKLIEDLPISRKTAAVFVYLGVNDAQAIWLRPHERGPSGREYLPWSDERWSGLYTERARQLVERICQRGARHAFMVLPVDVKRARLQQRLERIRKLQARAIARTSCGVVLPTQGDERSFGDDESPLRRRDGFHLTQQGAEVVWERIRKRTVAALRQRSTPARAVHAAVAPTAAEPEGAGVTEATAASSGRRAELDALVARMLGEAGE
jgi:hypothetical protein